MKQQCQPGVLRSLGAIVFIMFFLVRFCSPSSSEGGKGYVLGNRNAKPKKDVKQPIQQKVQHAASRPGIFEEAEFSWSRLE